MTCRVSENEVRIIRSACERYRGRGGEAGKREAKRLRALLLLLLSSGLRIRDAVTLRRSCVEGGLLRLHTSKTGTVVNIPLPGVVIEALAEVQSPSPDHYFWTGQSKPKSAVGDWQRALQRFFRFAGIENGHAHRFRHTLAVMLLERDVPMEGVSSILGHQSIKRDRKALRTLGWVASETA